MGITGKYDFPGIQKAGAAAIKALIASTSWGAIILSWPIVPSIIDFLDKQLVNYLANEGLIVLNIAASMVEGEIDQKAFDNAMDQALEQVANAKGGLTDAQKKSIDDAVIKAVMQFGPLDPT